MNTPQSTWISSFSDLPPLRTGGRIYLVTDGADGGMAAFWRAKGFTVDVATVSDGVLDDYDGVAARVPLTTTRLVCAVGGYACMEVAKVVAARCQLLLWCLPSNYGAVGALRCTSLWHTKERLVAIDTPTHSVFLVQSLLRNEEVHQAYAHLFGYYVSLCYAILRRHMVNDAPADDLEQAQRQAAHTLLAAPTAKDEGKRLWKAIEQAAPYTQEEEIQRLSYAIYLYKRGSLSYNKYEFVAALALGGALAHAQWTPQPAFPPDRMAVWQRLRGLGLGNTPPCAMPSYEEYKRLDWVWRDYLDDAKASLSDLATIAKYWRRLVRSAGYGYFEDLTADETTKLLSVAAELCPDYSALHHLYWRGLFDPFAA